jgi:hypothetical protein
VSDSHTYFALREVRRHFSSPRVLGALFGISVILGMAGPFGTGAFMRTGPLVVYWIIIAYTTYAAGSFVAAWSAHYCRAHKLNQTMSILITSLGTGIAAVLIVVLVNWAALGLPPTAPGYLGTLTLTTFVTATIIAVLLFFSGLTDAEQDTPAPAQTPRLLERLPFDKRGALISLSVSDHYVEVTTTRGQDLLLMRLGDAIKDCDGVAGMQVHRSHWIALDQVQAVRRAGDRAIVTMRDGRDIPVSRSYVPAVKDTGLLPS